MPIPFKEITLGEKTYKLRFGMGAMVEYEELTGNKLTEFGYDTSMSDLCKVIWVMLKQENDSLTLKSASKLIDDKFDGTMDDLMKLVNDVIEMALPTPENPKKPTVKKKTS
jgi:hypothetical protein